MELFITALIKDLLFPPGILFLLLAVGLLLLKSAPQFSKLLLWSTLAFACLLSMPFTAHLLHQSLAAHPVISPSALHDPKVGAIVVLSSNLRSDAMEYGEDTIGDDTLMRLRYGVYLHRKTGLPIIVSGGRVHNENGKSLAQTMADSLKRDFQIENIFMEEQSRTTFENARYTRLLLEQHKINQIILVTHSSHMKRAMLSFQQQHINAVAAPTLLPSNNQPWLLQLLPSAYALNRSRVALHEWLGIVWYNIRHF